MNQHTKTFHTDRNPHTGSLDIKKGCEYGIENVLAGNDMILQKGGCYAVVTDAL